MCKYAIPFAKIVRFWIFNMNKALTSVLFTLFIIFSITPHLYGGPVRNTSLIFTQPDGSTFAATVRGDEWTKIRTTPDGCTIIQDTEGWWCYGVYSEECTVECTGYRVGSDAPSEIISASRDIPFRKLAEKAAQRRDKTRYSNRKALESIRKANSPAVKGSTPQTDRRGIVILAQFLDTKFTFTKDDFLNMLNKEGYKSTGSAKDYFEDQFGEGWTFTFDVSDIVTLPHSVKYYGENDNEGYDIRPSTMAWEACKAADSTVDFSLYDMDGDGEVENVYIFYAGLDESAHGDKPDLIWAHQYYIVNDTEKITGYKDLDGVKVDRYACSSELEARMVMTGIGTFCHEFAHTFGLPDFYDTDYDNDGSWAAGLWKSTALMDGGNYNNNSATPPNLNSIERMLLGLTEPVELQSGRTYTLDPVYQSKEHYILKTKTEGEYFLLECRSNEGWDKYIGGKGMLVYHIDENGEELVDGYGMVNKWEYNTLNSNQKHQCADLIEADGRSDLIKEASDFNYIRGIFYPQSNVTSISSDITPSFKAWNGKTMDQSIIGISQTGDKITFSVVAGNGETAIPEIDNIEYTTYPDAIYITFKAEDASENHKVIMEWNRYGDTKISAAELSLSDKGTFAYLIEGLESRNTVYEISLRYSAGGIIGATYKTQIMTKRNSTVTWPYFYMTDGGNVKRNEGIIAHVVNTAEAVEKSWFLNDEVLPVRNDGRIYPQTNGTLKCEIIWKDGATDTILKEINVTD